MSSDPLASLLSDLGARRVVGGVAGKPGESEPRPDATAWTILAFRAARSVEPGAAERSSWVRELRRELADQQSPDGRLALSASRETAYWPTALAVLAWAPSPESARPRERAVDFLIHRAAGLAVPRSPFVGHDSTLVGWSWIQATHSWVEPTCLALLALERAGRGDHPRCVEARKLLLDRQLTAGGWNYGNTVTFGQQMRAAPDSTGYALSALAGRTSPGSVAPSVAYLEDIYPRLRSPLATGWATLGLSAWGRRPSDATDKLAAVLDRQSLLGAFDTALLSLLAIAWQGNRGLEAAIR